MFSFPLRWDPKCLWLAVEGTLFQYLFSPSTLFHHLPHTQEYTRVSGIGTSHWGTITIVLQGQEPSSFTCHFLGWERRSGVVRVPIQLLFPQRAFCVFSLYLVCRLLPFPGAEEVVSPTDRCRNGSVSSIRWSVKSQPWSWIGKAKRWCEGWHPF